MLICNCYLLGYAALPLASSKHRSALYYGMETELNSVFCKLREGRWGLGNNNNQSLVLGHVQRIHIIDQENKKRGINKICLIKTQKEKQAAEIRKTKAKKTATHISVIMSKQWKEGRKEPYDMREDYPIYNPRAQ